MHLNCHCHPLFWPCNELIIWQIQCMVFFIFQPMKMLETWTHTQGRMHQPWLEKQMHDLNGSSGISILTVWNNFPWFKLFNMHQRRPTTQMTTMTINLCSIVENLSPFSWGSSSTTSVKYRLSARQSNANAMWCTKLLNGLQNYLEFIFFMCRIFPFHHND